MALDTFISGRFTGTYAGLDVGITQTGYELSIDTKGELINQTDAYGDAIIDVVYRGFDAFLQFQSKAYKAGSVAAFYPWSTLGLEGTIGQLASNVATSMVLTAVVGPPATGGTLTAAAAILAPNSPASLLFDSRVRNVPVRLLCLPYSSGGIRRFA